MIALIRVDLPAPFSPMSECTSPGKSRKSTASSAGVGAEVDGPPRELEQRAGLHPPSIPTAGSYLRRSERKTMMRCTPMNSSSMSPTMIRVQDCSAPWNEMIVLMVP